MADQENACVRVTRAASRKRAAALSNVEEHQQPKLKKRVVLGELPNLPNTVVPFNSGNAQKGNKRPAKPKSKKGITVKKEELPFPLSAPAPETEPAALQESTKKAEINGGEDCDDPQMCEPYASDIYEYLHKLELDPKRRALPDYIEKIQKGVTPNMRGILVDWLVEVGEEYKLVPDTLYLTINYIDRYLSKNLISRQKLQLLGVSSMLIASKYEEISPPNVEDFCYITDNTYTKDEVVKMEADILKLLKFELGSPTVKTFLRRFTRIAQEDYKNSNLQLEFLGYYLAELSLVDYNCVKFLPSLVASSVVFLARFMMRPKTHPWSSALQEQSGYKPADLKECVLVIHDLYLSRRGGGLQAVRDKYKQHKFKCVASMPSPPEVPAAFFEETE